MRESNLKVVRCLKGWASLGLLVFSSAVCSAQIPELVVQTGHSRPISALAFTADGKMLASGSSDHTIKLWEMASGQELRTLTGHSGGILAVAFSVDGQKLASASSDKMIKSWDVATGKELHTFAWCCLDLFSDDYVVSAAFSPDAKTLVSGSYEGTIVLWDVATGSELRTLGRHSDFVQALAFSSDGRTLASGSGTKDTTIRLWDVDTGRELRRLTGHIGEVIEVAFSADGTTLASSGGYGDPAIHVWDVANGRMLRSIAWSDAMGSSLALSADGKTLASGSYARKIGLWDAATGQKVRTLTGPCASATIASVNIVAFSPNGKMLASGNDCDGKLNLWEVSTGREVNTAVHSDSVKSVAFTSNGKGLSSIARDQGIFPDSTIDLWDVASGMRFRTLTFRRNFIVVLSANGEAAASGNSSPTIGDKTIKLWDVGTGRELRTLRGHTGTIWSLAFSPDGQTIASGSDDMTVRLWDVTTGRRLHTLTGHGGGVSEVSFSADGRILASGSVDKTVRLWDAATGRELRTLAVRSGHVSTLIFTADGKTLASCSWDDSIITLWNVVTGLELHSLSGDAGGVSSIGFSVDGTRLASSSRGGEIRLWEVNTGRKVRTLIGHRLNVNSVAFSADGKFLVSGSDDRTSKIWDTISGEELASVIAFDKTDWAVVTPDGLFDGSPSAWHNIIWRFNNNTFTFAPVESFFGDFYYPGLLTDILAGRRPKAPSDISLKDRRQPQLKLTRGNAKLAARNAVIKIDISQAPAGAQDVRLFRNGSLIKVWHGDVLKGQSSVTLEATIPVVAGENQLTAYAFNRDNIKSSDTSLAVTGADSLKRAGILYVLAIGANKYKSPGYDLKFAVADINEITQQIKANQAKLLNYARTEIITLTDQEATKANIMLALQRFAAGSPVGAPLSFSPVLKQQLSKIKYLEPEDGLVIYYAGHGTAIGEHFYMLPTDFVAGDEQQLKASSISDIELNEALERLDAGKLLMVIDACQSGQALGGEKEGRGPMNSKGLAQLAYDKGMYILTAAQSYQAALEVSRSQVGQKIGHGLLTFALLEGLNKGIKDAEGRISERNWMKYAVAQVPLMQMEEMKKRSLENKQTNQKSRRGAELLFGFGDLENTDPEQRRLQRPRVFYRRELEAHSFIVAKP